MTQAQEIKVKPLRPTSGSGMLKSPSGKWTVHMEVGGEPKAKPGVYTQN